MTHLTPGDSAPNFNSVTATGQSLSLKDYTGKKLALYFYPRDMTPTCTTQACNLRDHWSILEQHGIHVLGVSDDPIKKHQQFIEKHQLPFPLLADEQKEVLRAYGVWGPKKFMGREFDGTHRTTFLIDEDGMIVGIINKVKAKEHAHQILEGFGVK